ncbi:MAG: polysaccharide biosynthesis protein, partial [Candidatus Aenigmarchaeota archaeon]|nr:polysaccharide biosynthesis protein [Candidatus Aenigmarchaeota archaeon]
CCAINPECQIESIGIRPGEKLHEILISEEEARYTYDMGDYYVICPPPSCKADYVGPEKSVAEEFSYSSKNNDQWLGIRDLRSLIKELKLE